MTADNWISVMALCQYNDFTMTIVICPICGEELEDCELDMEENKVASGGKGERASRVDQSPLKACN